MKHLFRLGYLNVIILTGLVAISILSILFFLQMRQLTSSNNWVTHTQETIEYGHKVLDDVQQIQINAQLYIITREHKYLGLYNASTQSVVIDLEKLRLLTQDNVEQQNIITQLYALLTKKLSIINSHLLTRKQHNLAFTWQQIKKNKSQMIVSRELTVEISGLVNTILNHEINHLKLRNASFVSHLTLSNKIAIIINLASLLIIFSCLILLNRQLLMRYLAERKLQKSQL